MIDDFAPLTSADHWLGWLGDNPAGAIRGEIEEGLRRQVPSATISWIRLIDTPYFLTGGRKLPENPDRIVVTRAGLAAPFVLEVRSQLGAEELHGVFSWVAVGLDGNRRDRTYSDLSTNFAEASDLLTVRLYELDAEEPT